MNHNGRRREENLPESLLAFVSLKIVQYLIYPEELRVANQIFHSFSVTLFEGGAYFLKFAYYDAFFHSFSLFN